jgi:hypothetical protein
MLNLKEKLDKHQHSRLKRTPIPSLNFWLLTKVQNNQKALTQIANEMIA